MKNTLDLNLLKSPPAAFRGAPFWSWNGVMEEQRVADQLRSFYDAGMGGAFIHSRSGLKTPYMEEQWFSCVKASVDTAKACGKKVYLYDEDRYSSGFAGGEVCREHPEFRMRHLTVATQPVADGETVAVFAVCRSAPDRVSAYRLLAEGEQAQPGEEILWFQACDFVSNPRWHNDSDPTDLCNPAAVQRFVDLAYEPYAAAFGADFGDTIPAIFTDEVCLTVLPSGKRTEYVLANHHWTADYPEIFKKRYGYDFRDHFPELFFAMDAPCRPTLQKDYLQGLADLFEENFSKRMATWCQNHDIAFTGHLNFAGFLDFARVGNPMRHYFHWQWPGMDILTDQVAKLAAFKMTASAAHQYGDGRVICETYGCTGWDWPPERHRFHAGWQFCLGVNFRCHHLSHYTLAGWGKKDYPASISHHSPWFEDYNQIEDHCGRISYALTRGKYAARTLVFSPYETVVSLYHGNHFGDTDPVGVHLENLNAMWEQINRTLIAHHVDFDYGDQSVLREHGVWEDGTIAIGDMVYDKVLVLPGHHLDKETKELLRRANVAVVTLETGEVPDDLLRQLGADLQITADGVNEPEVWSTRRLDGDKTILFLQSMAQEKKTVTVTMEKAENVLLVDELTGDLIAVPSESGNSFSVTLLPEANALLLCGYDAQGKQADVPMPENTLALPKGFYDYALAEPNALPLDSVQFAFEAEDWSEEMSVSEAEEKIRDRYDLPPQSFYDAMQPWYIHRHCYASYPEVCRMRFAFSVAELPGDCTLVMEGYDSFEAVTCNGIPLPRPDGHFIDQDLQTIPIAQYLQLGRNEVELTFHYCTDLELENMALVGNFAVTAKEKTDRLTAQNVQIAALPKQITSGAWAENGLPFYTGRLSYFYEWESNGAPCKLDLSDAKTLGCAIVLNGQKTTRLCPPFVFDLTDSLKKGENRLEIQLIAGRKNLLGPLHVEREKIVEPGDFHFGSPFWENGYMLHEYGLIF